MKTYKKFYTVFGAVAIIMVCLTTSCDETSKENQITPYDPSKPIVLTSFSPDSGRFRTRIILEGENFGSDPDNIRVYFNNKKAAVVGSSGNKMYVIVPRIAANIECDVSVAVGNDSIVYPKKFRYEMNVAVTTVAGNGNNPVDGFQASSLPGIISPWMLDVDADGNIFVSLDAGAWVNGVIRINEEDNYMYMVAQTAPANNWADRAYGMSIDKTTGVVYTTIGEAITSYLYMDPKEDWAPRSKTFRWVENPNYVYEGMPYPSGSIGGKYMCYNSHDGYLYTRYSTGHIVRIDPVAGTGMVLYVTPEGSLRGNGSAETQSPDIDPTGEWCYMGGNGGQVLNGLYRFNVNDVPNTWERLNHNNTPDAPTNIGGHRDGPVEQALFTNIWGLRFDPDGLLYICDYNNHCIRRYDPGTRMVETVLGIPGSPGFRDGGREVAQFNLPSCLGIDPDGNVYISDRNNRRVRKLAIE